MVRIACVLMFAVFLGACETTTGDAVIHEWEAALSGEPGWTHLTGTTTVVSQPAAMQFTAMAELEGDESGAVRPWHVHFNSCAEGGGIVGQDGDYPRLEVGADGSASVTVTIAQPLDAGATYHVNVHHSDADLATIIACGDLVLVN